MSCFKIGSLYVYHGIGARGQLCSVDNEIVEIGTKMICSDVEPEPPPGSWPMVCIADLLTVGGKLVFVADDPRELALFTEIEEFQ